MHIFRRYWDPAAKSKAGADREDAGGSAGPDGRHQHAKPEQDKEEGESLESYTCSSKGTILVLKIFDVILSFIVYNFIQKSKKSKEILADKEDNDTNEEWEEQQSTMETWQELHLDDETFHLQY